MKKFIYTVLAAMLNIAVVSAMESSIGLYPHFSQIASKNNNEVSLDKKRRQLGKISVIKPQKACDIDQRIMCEELAIPDRRGVCYNYAMTETLKKHGINNTFTIIGCQDWQRVLYFFKRANQYKQGDLAVYFNVTNGKRIEVAHFGLVADPETLLMEGKWGTIKAIYKHPMFCLPEGYGKHVTVMRLKKPYRVVGQDQDMLIAHIENTMEKPERTRKVLEFNERQLLSLASRPISDAKQDKYRIITILEQLPCVRLNPCDSEGRTPLMIAAAHDNVVLTRLFLAYGADKDIQDNAGNTALDIAMEKNNPEILSLLQ